MKKPTRELNRLIAQTNSAREAGFRRIFTLFLCGFFLAPAAGCHNKSDIIANLEVGSVELREYRLGPGDKTSILVLGREDLSGEFEVDSTGRIALPLIGGIDAKGLSILDLEQTVKQYMELNHVVDPIVTVELVKARPFCVLGEVRKPGCFDYRYGMRAAMAIAIAGGYTYRAVEQELIVTREDGNKVKGDHETAIFPGDIIEVPERYF